MKDLKVISLIDIKRVIVNEKDTTMLKGIFIELPHDRFIMFEPKAFEDIITQVDKIRQKQNEQDTS